MIINGVESERQSVVCGVPQGSILGPLLFSIYVNDMMQSVDCELLLYADDSALVIADKNPKIIEQKLSKNLEYLSAWLEENKLSLHLGKTESILLGSKRKLSKCKKLEIDCNDIKIEATDQIKYLGLKIDQDMAGISMAQSALGKINSRLKFLYRKRIHLNTKDRKLLCSSLIQSNYDYGCNSWYRGLSQSLKNKFQTAQNKTIRFILD